MPVSGLRAKYWLNPRFTAPNASIESAFLLRTSSHQLISSSIIAIQGLWANPEYTWARNGVMWLRDLLPADIPVASIMTFEPVTRSAHYESIYLRYVRKTWHWILLVLSISFTILHRLRSMLLLVTAGLMFPIAVLAFRGSYRRLAYTPRTEILDQAKKLLDCLKERKGSLV
jgi:hypothetical protein